MVDHKIGRVSDEVCAQCAQCWEGECRAFTVPHSEAERIQRVTDPRGACQKGRQVEWHKIT